MHSTRHPLRKCLAVFLMASLTIGGLAPAAQAATKKIICYPASADVDGDGYARPFTTAMAVTPTGIMMINRPTEGVELTVDATKSMNCPSGYVNEATDCDDYNAAVHPFNDEIAFNGIDDNCNDVTDEPGPIYSAAGNGNTASSFNVTFHVRHAQMVAAAGNLWVRLYLRNLSSSQTLVGLPMTQVTGLSAYYPYATVAVTGLAPSTVYSVFARFYAMTGGVLMQIGPESDTYYTTTDAAVPVRGMAPLLAEAAGAQRTTMLLRAFKELDDSNRGRVGYRGSVHRDGTRYGASLNEKWCTEFYAWVTKTYVVYPSLPTTVDDAIDFFSDRGAYYGATSLATVGRRADYLPSDSDGDGTLNHSTMFLAYDTSYSPPMVWTIEGNWGNRVTVSRRSIGSDIQGLGHVTSGMLW
jgi:Putative metal-binding motif